MKESVLIISFQFTIQDLNLKVSMAQQAELQAKTELEDLKVEIQTERAHVRAARDIEKHKQELSLETKWCEFRSGTEDVNTHLDSLLKSFGQLSNVHVTFADKSFGKVPMNGICCLFMSSIFNYFSTHCVKNLLLWHANN